MYKVYFEDKVIIFDKDIEINNDKSKIIFYDNETPTVSWESIHRTVCTEMLNRITIVSDDIDTVFNLFCASLYKIEAAGGVVKNNIGETLMIYRFNKWDFPKGKREYPESLETCAIREVSEECGIDIEGIEIKKHITNTYHVYKLNDRWIIKATSWYSMNYTGTTTLKPQTEEGISGVQWVKHSDITQLLQHSYHTIIDLYNVYISN